MLDGLSGLKAGIAAIVSQGVVDRDVSKVKVSVRPHGHSAVLRDGHHGWQRGRGRIGVRTDRSQTMRYNY